MAKKYTKTILSNLNMINKKTFLAMFFVLIFSFFVSLAFFQSVEEMKISVQVARGEEEEEAPPCVPACGSCECCYCDPCTCDCSCAGPSSQWPPPGYQENRICHKSIDCQCCSCSATCNWGPWFDVEWCGDGSVNDTEECDAGSISTRTCNVFNTDYPAGLPNDGLSNILPYNGLFLCNRCNWQYFDIDGGAGDSQICYGSSCAGGESQEDCTPGGISQLCDWAGMIGSYDCSIVAGNNACKWDDNLGLNCTPIDWCGDGNINGAELYCDTHQASGTSDFGGQDCRSKVCNDIDPTDTEDKSSYSKNPNCSAQNFNYNPLFPLGKLTCANTCRHIYTVPACNFPLNATGVDLSDDGQYVFATDSSLWSLQMFPVSTPAISTANPDKLIAIYYLDAEPLSVDISGDYAYIGTKGDPLTETPGEFVVIYTNQFNRTDDYPDPGNLYVSPPFRPKDVPHLPFREEQPPEIRAIPEMVKIPTLGEVNDVHIVGNYAYLAIGKIGNIGPAALQIINISNPLAPVSVGSYSYPNTKTGVRSVDVSGNYAYVAYTDGNNGVGYFDYFNISNKANPVKMLAAGIDISSSTSSIDISGSYAFIGGFSTFNSIDITNPANPFAPPTVHTTDNLNLGHDIPPNETFAMDIDNSGNVAYVSVKNIGLRAVNISDPENISESIIFAAPGNAPIIADVIINTAGNYAYAAGLGAGLLVFNLTKVFNLTQHCGDGIRNGFEICDGGDLGGITCASYGAEGNLSCKRFCNGFDFSGCINCGDFGFSDPNCVCAGVLCNTPGFCETGPGSCRVVNNAPVCVYPNNPNKCNTPGFCQVGPGRCDEEANVCRYLNDPDFCMHLDGDVCTGDRCISLDGGLTSSCMLGSNICGGLIPCDRMVNDPSTPWDDTASCEFCHGIMLLNQGMNFLLKIASAAAILALIITGFLFITSAGSPERKNTAKTAFKWIIIGFLILFLSWLIVDFILSAWGFLDPLGGKWNVVC